MGFKYRKEENNNAGEKMKDNFRTNFTIRMKINQLGKLALIANKELKRSQQLAEEIITNYIKEYEKEHGEIEIKE